MRCSESIAVQRIIHCIDQPTWIAGETAEIVAINDSALSVMGYADYDCIIGQNSHLLFHHSRLDGSEYRQADCPLFHRPPMGKPETAVRRGAEWFIKRTGSIVPVEWSTTTLEVDSTELTMVSLNILGRDTPTATMSATGQGRRSDLDRKQVYKRAYRIITTTSDDRGLTPKGIAAQLHVSLRYLQSAFAEAGESPAQLIRLTRLQRALGLLESGFGVAETAERAGFSDPSTFRRNFQRHFNATPLERRRL